jgi:hypothetical protein
MNEVTISTDDTGQDAGASNETVAATAAVAEVKADIALAQADDNAVTLETLQAELTDMRAMLSNLMGSIQPGISPAEREDILGRIAALEEDIEDVAEEAAQEAAVTGAVAGGIVAEEIVEDVPAEPEPAKPGEENAPEERKKRKRHFL